ncbi:MAG: restriction endonuclease [Candidatus Yanofskybacteria bacterium RIFCSPLOWO2_02_FULL_43_10]|uniref:Restriction endonuclease n=1 Tax=Candidatus Yanofskybacteria bacterium RIFCSPLOWO2_12_FULL_43_11b TaxID=1802710 RepID=A0A1F8H6N7_9BACT|nr:MAG: restriction endonuclease [Candidatus Yanofskybacteria bacterium RIFCSPHIGHO2_01_FULL_43_32]OGN11970.1 MAG: restriction endonuclease [Candidatus Yanofskybacteria bacterium RIFCSPHIGHO2_02_FULL_43_12]OGN17285.1 MAG: restriction endonuclease [Candidatus Yanofskybacteria bacterium RIFCSPHIGHO2_12_FULL_43_11]OGN24754.1 MAG: restriction endonuclease [Candidatus Yanofskybacteria bacterium RIFCSPLOWO2_01_FULL_43_46]OGN30609.1 MAG: restriction endonuclease [Candidatus Yanofskybacteria bacterium 
MKTLKIDNKKLLELLNIEPPKFAKYSGPLMNLANRFIGGTKPKVVGQMSELIKEFDGKTFKEWESWYLKKHPKAIDAAVEKITQMLINFKDVLEKTDEASIKRWVRDLVIIKTFVGLKNQEAILKSVAEYFKTEYRSAKPAEESKGIDGFIGEKSVSIKPHTYLLKPELLEKIEAPIIYYEKTKTGLKIYFPENLTK